MPSFEDLKLTKAQQAKFDALYEAHQACLKSGIKFISFDESMYPLNGKKLKDVSTNDHHVNSEPSKQFVASSMPSGWDSIHVEEPYCQTQVCFTLK